jgi:hypothetical protein
LKSWNQGGKAGGKQFEAGNVSGTRSFLVFYLADEFNGMLRSDSSKYETVMQALLKSDKHTFEGGDKVRKLIYWILIKYGAKFVENVLEGGETGDLSVKWTDLRSGGDELRSEF